MTTEEKSIRTCSVCGALGMWGPPMTWQNRHDLFTCSRCVAQSKSSVSVSQAPRIVGVDWGANGGGGTTSCASAAQLDPLISEANAYSALRERARPPIYTPTAEEDSAYRGLLTAVASRLHGISANEPLFTTECPGLFDAFLHNIGREVRGSSGLNERRSHYECRECRSFFERYGGLVTINAEGKQTPVFWHKDGWIPPFSTSMAAVYQMVSSAKVTGIFKHREAILGTVESRSGKTPSGWFHHFHAYAGQGRPGFFPVPAGMSSLDAYAGPEKFMAEKREEYAMLWRALSEFSVDTAGTVVELLRGLPRAEKHLPMAQRFAALKNHRSLSHQIAANIVWRAVALAPSGFAHIRNTVVGAMLEDVKAYKSADVIRANYLAKVDGIHYQRPQAAPKAGQVDAAEALIAKLGLERAFARCYATFDDVRAFAFWTDHLPEKAGVTGGIFGHLRPHHQPPYDVTTKQEMMTWVRFRRDVLPIAQRIEYRIPGPKWVNGQILHMQSPFFAFLTAAIPDAPHLFQWETEAVRQPVNWYLYHGGSKGQDWGCAHDSFVRVNAITSSPSMWGPVHTEHGDGAYFILDGCHDVRAASGIGNPGLGLFPDELRSDLRGIRSTIEAFSNRGRLTGQHNASACGIAMQKGPNPYVNENILRVTSGNVRKLYLLDRWE